MNGLTTYERDAEIVVRAGEPDQRPPDADALLALVRDHLVGPHGDPPLDAAWEHARWKPGVAISAVYEVRFGDGARSLVTWKRYSGAKANAVAERPSLARRPSLDGGRLGPCATLSDGAFLWAYPTDRVLRGLERALDVRRTWRLVTNFGCFEPWSIRRRRTEFELLRYKPERRAVLRARFQLKGGDMRDERSLAVRILPLAAAQRAARRRSACFGTSTVEAPRFIGHDATAGALFEEWLDAAVPARDDFVHAQEAGALLARLHAHPAVADGHDPLHEALDGCAHLLGSDPGLARAFAKLKAQRESPASTWIHGDLHPDNVALDRAQGRHRWLDLDALRPGAPAVDLASWTCDQLLAGSPDPGAALLDGYLEAGGRPTPSGELEQHVALELVQRAAASLRRLERGAVARAHERLELAREWIGRTR